MPELAVIAITAVFSVLVIVGIAGNSVVCVIIKRNRDMRTPMNYLLLNLAVADILYAMFIAPKVLFVKLHLIRHPDGMTGTVLCKLLTSGQIGWIGATASFVTLSVIAVERYYAVVYPLGGRGKLTKRKLKVIISGSWIFSIILNIPPFLIWNFDKGNTSCVFIWPEKWMGKTYLVEWKIIVVLTMAIMVVLYSKVVYALWFKTNDDNQLTYQQQRVMRVRRRATLMVVTVSGIFGICWGTDIVVYVIDYVASYNVGPVPVAIANTMVLFNSAVNPFVYALLNQQFREKIKKIVCCRGSLTSVVYRTRKPQDMNIANIITYPTQTAEACSQE